jgi:hypothetical protein
MQTSKKRDIDVDADTDTDYDSSCFEKRWSDSSSSSRKKCEIQTEK